MKKILPISLGCVKNQIDLEYLLGNIIGKEFSLTDDFNKCDFILVNTCSFIADAREESESVIERFIATGKLIVTGCYPQREKNDFKIKYKDVKWVLGTEGQKASKNLMTALKSSQQLFVLNDNLPEYCESAKRLSFGGFHAYVKLSEGCSRKCAFCAIPDIRGILRSRKKKSIFEEIRSLEQKAYKEFNLVSEDSSMYGREIYRDYSLRNLIKDLSFEMPESLFRLMYVFPDKTVYSTIDAIDEADNFIKYIDTPFQHVSKRMLKSMGRFMQEDPRKAAEYAIKKSILLRSSVMVGFPGEKEKDFDELLRFVENGYVSKLGVFIYSDEKNTPAYKLKGKVSRNVKIERFNEIIKAYRKITAKKMRMNIGNVKKAVFTSRTNGMYIGRLIEDAPSVDSALISERKYVKLNELTDVKILDIKNYTYIA